MAVEGANREASRWLQAFGKALANHDIAGATLLFEKECYWRDLVSLTWTLKTFEGRDEVKAMLSATLAAAKPANVVQLGPATEANGAIEAWFAFETATGRGNGHLRLRNGKCWTMLTTLQELKGFEEKAGRARERGVEQGVHPDRLSWAERRRLEESALGMERQPYVVIIGGGQSGLALAARLKRLQVPALVIEKNERAVPSTSGRRKRSFWSSVPNKCRISPLPASGA